MKNKNNNENMPNVTYVNLVSDIPEDYAKVLKWIPGTTYDAQKRRDKVSDAINRGKIPAYKVKTELSKPDNGAFDRMQYSHPYVLKADVDRILGLTKAETVVDPQPELEFDPAMAVLEHPTADEPKQDQSSLDVLADILTQLRELREKNDSQEDVQIDIACSLHGIKSLMRQIHNDGIKVTVPSQ